MNMSEPIPGDRDAILAAVRECASGKVKVAVADVDGILRGKYVHRDKFVSAVDGGIGFSVFGTDLNDRPYEDGYANSRRLGFPDATVQLDLATYRRVPWDGDVPFFLGNFVRNDGSPHPLCPRQVLKRVLARADSMGLRVMAGTEYEFVNFRETPESWAEKHERNHDSPPSAIGEADQARRAVVVFRKHPGDTDERQRALPLARVQVAVDTGHLATGKPRRFTRGVDENAIAPFDRLGQLRIGERWIVERIQRDLPRGHHGGARRNQRARWLAAGAGEGSHGDEGRGPPMGGFHASNSITIAR